MNKKNAWLEKEAVVGWMMVSRMEQDGREVHHSTEMIAMTAPIGLASDSEADDEQENPIGISDKVLGVVQALPGTLRVTVVYPGSQRTTRMVVGYEHPGHPMDYETLWAEQLYQVETMMDEIEEQIDATRD